MKDTDKEELENLGKILGILAEQVGIYAIAFGGDIVSEKEVQDRTNSLVNKCIKDVLAWHTNQVAKQKRELLERIYGKVNGFEGFSKEIIVEELMELDKLESELKEE